MTSNTQSTLHEFVDSLIEGNNEKSAIDFHSFLKTKMVEARGNDGDEGMGSLERKQQSGMM